MKLVRLKITDPAGFRSLQPGFEYCFRSEWALQDQFSAQPQFSEPGFAPFVCAGPNGSGKSNILEALAAIFYHLECMYLESVPDSFVYDEELNPQGYRSDFATPNGFEIEYLIKPKQALTIKGLAGYAHIKIIKKPDHTPEWYLLNDADNDSGVTDITVGRTLGRDLLPQYVLGYSSGENEILSLPFFKMRFIQFDEYWKSLTERLPYAGNPETRMAYIDSSFSQAILLCNLLYSDSNGIELFAKDMGLGDITEFRIIIKRTIPITLEQAQEFEDKDKDSKETIEELLERNPALKRYSDETEQYQYTVDLTYLLEKNIASADNYDPIITRLKRCATCYFVDESTDCLYLDYCVNDATKKAFAENFSFEANKSAIELFQTFQVLLSLNLYTVSDTLKTDLYQSNSLYVSETVPMLASDERIMRFKNYRLNKDGIKQPVLLKSLSDGEHQLLHSLGLCLLFKDTNSLFLLDEPETHFNPAWRSNFISRLRACFPEGVDKHSTHEMLITTHTPFLISDSEKHKVLIFDKDPSTQAVSIRHPEYNTLGASINKITIETFDKHETIGGYAQSLLDQFREEFKAGDVDIDDLLQRMDRRLGDSVEKLLLIKSLTDQAREQG